jgi:hypothetical protein
MCWNGYVRKWRIILTTCHNSCVEPMRQTTLCASHHQSALWLGFRDFVARILLVIVLVLFGGWLGFRDFVARILLVIVLVLFGGWVGIVSFPFSSSSSCTLAVATITSQLAISFLLDGEQCGRGPVLLWSKPKKLTCTSASMFCPIRLELLSPISLQFDIPKCDQFKFKSWATSSIDSYGHICEKYWCKLLDRKCPSLFGHLQLS